MKIKKLLPLYTGILTLSLFTGCSDETNNVAIDNTQVQEQAASSKEAQANQSQGTTLETVSAIQSITLEPNKEHYTFDWRSGAYETIELGNGSATITSSGIYEVTGNLEEGNLVIDIDKDVDEGTVFVILNNAHINSTSGTPIQVVDAEKVVFLLEEGTTNTIIQGSIETADEDFPSAAIYSKADTVITGEGTLVVETAYNDGITSRDDLIITSGTIQIKAAGDGIVGKDLLAIEQGTITIEAGKDGLRSTNDSDEERGNIIIMDGNLTIKAANDGIQAERNLQIEGGTFDIASGNGYTGVIKVNVGELKLDEGGRTPQAGMGIPEGTEMPQGMERPQGLGIPEGTEMPQGMERPQGIQKPGGTQKQDGAQKQEGAQRIDGNENEVDGITGSMKALKAEEEILINGGNFVISSYEDAIHAGVNIEIHGGDFIINAGDDAIHSDNALSITNGTMVVENSFEGIEGSSILISGGTIDITSTDDGLNVFDLEGILTITGGDISLVPGNDGIDSNGDLTITGGTIIIDTTNINERNSAVDSEGIITHTGGTIVDQNGEAIDPTIQKQMGPAMKNPGAVQDPAVTQDPAGMQGGKDPSMKTNKGQNQSGGQTGEGGEI